MKNRMNRLMCLGVALAAAVAAHAQTASANVPFGYRLENRLMQAGTYLVSETSNCHVVWITGGGLAQASATVGVVGKGLYEPARLIFHKYGDEYFLAEIWTGRPDGQQVMMSRREKELARGGALPELAVIRIAIHN